MAREGILRNGRIIILSDIGVNDCAMEEEECAELEKKVLRKQFRCGGLYTLQEIYRVVSFSLTFAACAYELSICFAEKI